LSSTSSQVCFYNTAHSLFPCERAGPILTSLLADYKIKVISMVFYYCNTHGGGGGATRPLPRDGGVEELHGEKMFSGDWERLDGRAPRGSCLAISAHLSDRGAGTAPPR